MVRGQHRAPNVTDVSRADVTAVLASLNEAFYAIDPGSPLRARLAGLLPPTPGDAAPSVLQQQVSERLPGWVLDDDHEIEEHGSAEIIEAFSLAHQAGEVLLRHLLAQYDASQQSTSAWLALAAQNHREFRRRCKGLLIMSDEDLATVLEWVFIPLTDDQRAAVTEATLIATSRFVCAWIRHFAAYNLRTSNAYNAVKHGMCIRAGQASVEFVSQPTTPGEQPQHLRLMSGALIETLESRGTKKQRRWVRVHRGVDPAGLVTSAVIAVTLLDWLWTVAMARRDGGGAAIPLHDGPLPSAVFEGNEHAWLFEFTHDIAALPMPPDEGHAALVELGFEIADAPLDEDGT